MSENVQVTTSLPKKNFSFGFKPRNAVAVVILGAAAVIVAKAAKDKLDSVTGGTETVEA